MESSEVIQSYVGQKFTQAIANKLKSETGVSLLQICFPGQNGTCEHRPSRLNVVLKEDSIISSIYFG